MSGVVFITFSCPMQELLGDPGKAGVGTLVGILSFSSTQEAAGQGWGCQGAGRWEGGQGQVGIGGQVGGQRPVPLLYEVSST